MPMIARKPKAAASSSRTSVVRPDAGLVSVARSSHMARAAAARPPTITAANGARTRPQAAPQASAPAKAASMRTPGVAISFGIGGAGSRMGAPERKAGARRPPLAYALPVRNRSALHHLAVEVDVEAFDFDILADADRSEERRVGKECRARGSPSQ